MMIEEFTTLTGYKPTFEEYREIEQSYYDFDGDKQEFCALWTLNKAIENISCGLRNDIHTPRAVRKRLQRHQTLSPVAQFNS